MVEKTNEIIGNENITEYIEPSAGGGVFKGAASQIGHEVEYPNQYAKEFCIRIHNTKYKEEIIALLRNTVWEDVYAMTKSPNLLQWQIYKYLKERIPGIK